ncbi:mannose-1-phosphate guanylyltransferase [Epsilonproteobacteria bacterium SCGC AD-308-E02]|jgi:mannose-1-phosphate guanylyltransferase|nr:mannose-1-phosphate guanylyltransferase [Epsilonproteobacteria bacterium SCGC AD-308-E02]
MTNIILCGGNGTRLWPISRTLMPKQFVKLFNDESLFQLTVSRNKAVCSGQLIVSNAEQYFLAVDQLEELHKISNKVDTSNVKFLLEPIGRNTAPAIALACLALDAEEIVLVSPSDHLIKDEKAYLKVLQEAKELAETGSLVTFGIKPKYAETGYGYIEGGEAYPTHALASGVSAFSARDVKAFHEKPDEVTAKKYVDDGNFYWNSGMFCFKAGVFLEELQKYSPEIYNSSKLALDATYSQSHAESNNMIRILHNDMQAIPEDSIDYAVMEKSSKVKVVASDIGWSDLGSFDALDEELQKDENGNTINLNHISIDSKNNFIYGNERKIATVDIEDLIIVDTGDALLISKKGSSQKVKKVVEQVRISTELHNIHLTAHRPWGTYTILEDSNRYKIKRIEVMPGKRLSLQKHFHRNEHWIIVSGTATVTIEEKTFILRANESTYIKMGDIHRLANEGKVPVIMIEAQIGDYLGEDDIVRIEDDFKRL